MIEILIVAALGGLCVFLAGGWERSRVIQAKLQDTAEKARSMEGYWRNMYDAKAGGWWDTNYDRAQDEKEIKDLKERLKKFEIKG